MLAQVMLHEQQHYGAPSGTKIVHAPQRDYLDRVTETSTYLVFRGYFVDKNGMFVDKQRDS